MLKSIFSLWVALVVICPLLEAENVVRLQYMTDEPLELVAVHSIDITQTVPGIKFSASGLQTLTASLTIEGEHKQQPIFQPPLDGIIKFKNFRIDLNANQDTISFDSRQPGSSLLMAQLAKVIDRPIRFHINKKLAIDKTSEDLTNLVKEFPVLKEIDPHSMLEGIFQPVFALMGKDLTPGSKIQIKGVQGTFGVFPTNLIYEIESITDQNVTANVSGALEPQKLKLTGVMEVEDKKFEKIALIFSGNFNGKQTWDRENALLFKLTGDYQINGMLKIAEWEWPLSLTIKVDMGTRKQRLKD